MKISFVPAFVLLVPGLFAQSAEMQVVNKAAQALGGKQGIMSLHTLKVEGYGQYAHQNGGGNLTGSVDAPQKWVDINGQVRTFDLDHGRMRMEERLMQDFVFPRENYMTGTVKVHQVLDGDIAYDVNDGKPRRASEMAAWTRRIEMLNNPLVLIRTALDSASKLSKLRNEGANQVVDMVTAKGDRVTFAVDKESGFPAWMSWIGPDVNLGDVTYKTYWVGYQIYDGVYQPTGYNTMQDWRNVPWTKLYVARVTVDVPIGDLAAPAEVKASPLPTPRVLNPVAVPIAKGIWYLQGAGGNSALYEFADHLTMFEVYGSEANALANIQLARRTVPNKPLTEVIISHNHFDHSGGLRAAVAEGLTIVTHKGNEQLFRESASRPAKEFPDALGRSMKPIKFKLVDDHLVLKDNTMQVDVYRVISNNHMPHGVFAYAPSAKAVAEGDLSDQAWDIVWWGDSYPASMKYWKLDVEKNLPVHGAVHTYREVIDSLARQTKRAQELCAKVDAAGLSMRGCPLTNEPDLN